MRIKCLKPFYSLELHAGGDVSFCCVEWSKVGYIGNIKDNSLEEIWNGKIAQYIREKMYNEDLTDVCKPDVCPNLYCGNYYNLCETNNSELVLNKAHIAEILERRTFLTVKPTYVNLANSSKCNLRCIMCGPWRKFYKQDVSSLEDITSKSEKIETKDKDLANKIYQEIQAHLPFLKILRLTGAGEPLYRNDILSILLSKNRYPEMKIELATNGLLLTPLIWEKIKHNSFSHIDVSVDAASKGTYEKIRRGGKWDILMDNLCFISKLRANKEISNFLLNFTVMKSNYHEILLFIQLGKDLGCDYIYFQRVRGDICNGENIFDDNNSLILDELKKIKTEAYELASPNCSIAFWNM